ncbi:MAG: FG-GAP-like repeat-containing protein, partial [bacterium]
MLKSSEWYERGLDHSVLILALMTASVISWLLISELAWADWNSSQPPLGSKLKLLSNDEVVMLFDYLPDGMYLYEPESGQSIYEDKIGRIDQNDILDIAASNLDDDEWDEIAVVDNKGGIGENDAVWILDTGDGISWSWHGPHGISSPFIKDVACGDINGDGMDDIVFLDNGGGTGSAHRDALWWYKWGGASNDVLYYEGYYSSFWDYIKDIDCGDIDGDGYDEVVGIDVGGGSYDEIRIYDFNEAATYSIQPEQKGWVDMTCGNFDTNLITDEIVVLDSNGDNKDALWFYALNSDKTVKDFYHIYTDYNNLSSVASGDVNNDGHDDVVMLDNEGDNLDVIRFISLVMYDITIELIEPPPSFTARNSMGFDIACGDFDGDSPTTVFAQGYGPIDREDPNEVIAVLYAPPYERGMSEGTYDSQIGFEHSDTEGYSDALSVSMETTIGLSAGVETPFGGFKASVSASIDAGIEQTVGQQRTVTIGDVYSIADNPVDGVVVATTKYWAYFYQIVDPNNKLGTNSDGEYFVISVPKPKSMQSAPTIWTLEEAYNARARENGRPTIPSAHMVGDMRSYPNRLQYPDDGGMEGADVWISENLSPNKGTGPAVKKVSVDTMEFQETTLSAGVTLTAGFEVQGPGGSVGVSFERSTRVGVSATHMTAVGNSTTFLTSRGYIPADLYDTYSCTYKMFTYRHPDGYWVIDYYLTGLNWGHYLPVVIFPDGGENEILKGDTTITWKRPARYKQDNFSQINEVSIYEVYYSEDGGSNWTLIHTITDPATTSYAWNTASVPDDDNYKIKVKTTFDDGTTTADSSDNTFKINNVGPWAEIDVSGDNVLKEGGIIYISDEDIQRMMSITQEQWMALKAMGSPCTVTLNLINVTDSTTIEQVRFRQSVNGVIGPWQEFSYPGVSNVSTTSQDGTKWIEGQLQEKPEYGGEWWDIPDITIVQDTEPPELISFAVVDEDGDGYTQDTSVKLIIESYTDATSGINRMRFRHDMGPWEEHVYPQEFGLFESEEKDSINFPWTLSGANEGQRTISIQIVDKVGGGGRDDTPLKTATIFYDKNPPSAPTNLSASPTQEKITLTWNASSDPAPSSGMKMYNVYRSAWSPVQTNEDNLIAQVEENKYEDTDFIHHPGGGGLVVFNYYYVVTAVDMADNESDTSNTAIASISGTIINAKQLRALQLDGKKSDDDEYSYTDIAGALFRATFYPYYQAYNLYVRAAEDGEDLYLAFDIPDNTQNNNDYAAVLIDVDRDRSSQPQTDDLWLQIKRGADVGNEVSGTGSGWSGFRSPNEWDARSVDGPESWSAEFKIEYGKLDVQAWQTDTLGICFMAYDADATKWVLWPTGADKSKPNTWGKIYSSNLWRGDILNVSRGDLYDDVCYRGQKDAGVLPLELKIIDETQSTSNETIINSITLQRRGSSTDSDIAKVRLWDDRSTLGKVNSGDSLVAEGDLSSGWITFTNINYSVTWDTVSHLLASYEIDSNAALGHTVGAELTSVIVASPDRVTVRRSLTPGTTIEEPIISDSVRIVNAAPGFFGKNVESFAIVAGDLMLDGDTLADLVIGDVDSTRIYLSSNGFQFPLSLPDGVSRSLALADVDNDGNVDLVCGKEGEIALFIDPVFEFDGAATSLALGDLDHDGDPEVVVGTENGSFVLKNEGGTSFTLWQELNGGYTNDVALGDLDGDGDLDIVDGIW